jgi:hypothetical protein
MPWMEDFTSVAVMFRRCQDLSGVSIRHGSLRYVNNGGPYESPVFFTQWTDSADNLCGVRIMNTVYRHTERCRRFHVRFCAML